MRRADKRNLHLFRAGGGWGVSLNIASVLYSELIEKNPCRNQHKGSASGLSLCNVLQALIRWRYESDRGSVEAERPYCCCCCCWAPSVSWVSSLSCFSFHTGKEWGTDGGLYKTPEDTWKLSVPVATVTSLSSNWSPSRQIYPAFHFKSHTSLAEDQSYLFLFNFTKQLLHPSVLIKNCIGEPCCYSQVWSPFTSVHKQGSCVSLHWP